MRRFFYQHHFVIFAVMLFCGTLPAASNALAAGAQEAAATVNLNTADAPALESVRGIGPALASRIIEYRDQNGPFQTLDQLKSVKGIGEAKFEKIKDQLSL